MTGYVCVWTMANNTRLKTLFFCEIFSVFQQQQGVPMFFSFETILVGILSLAIFGAYNLVVPIAFTTSLHTVVFVTYPVPSFFLLLFILGLSLETYYTPTGLLVGWYLWVTTRHWITFDVNCLLKLVGFLFCYLAVGFIWIRWKWRLYLTNSKFEYALKNMKAGEEADFFKRHVPKLFPHFLYWPFSIVHVLCSDLVYRLFEEVLKSFGGYFTNAVEIRRVELQTEKE